MNNPGLVAGTVVDDSSQPVAGARVYFAGGPGSYPDVAALTGDDGKFVLSAPAPGSYQVQCQADGFAQETLSVKVAAGKTRTVRVKLRKG